MISHGTRLRRLCPATGATLAVAMRKQKIDLEDPEGALGLWRSGTCRKGCGFGLSQMFDEEDFVLSLVIEQFVSDRTGHRNAESSRTNA